MGLLSIVENGDTSRPESRNENSYLEQDVVSRPFEPPQIIGRGDPQPPLVAEQMR